MCPAFAHGGQDVKGAGDTASGLSMLMTSAARGIKGVIKTIDRNIIEKAVERQYDLNIEKVENAALVADFKIQAKGSSSLIAKEQQAIRRDEFLDTVSSKPDRLRDHVGSEGLKYLVKDTARAMELDRGQGGSRQSAATPPGRRDCPPFSRFPARAVPNPEPGGRAGRGQGFSSVPGRSDPQWMTRKTP